jgi:type VI protein secretion system component VasK
MIKPQPELMPGAPQWIVWSLGVIFIVLALALVYSVIAIAFGIYHEAQGRRTWPLFWLVAGLVGGWLTAIIWLVVRDRFPDLALEQIEANARAAEASAKTEG